MINDNDAKYIRTLCAKRLYKECHRIFQEQLESHIFEERLTELQNTVIVDILEKNWNNGWCNSYKWKVVQCAINKHILDITHSEEYSAYVDKCKQKLRKKLVCRSKDFRIGFMRREKNHFQDDYQDKQGILLERGSWRVISRKEVPVISFVPARWQEGRKSDRLPQIIYFDTQTNDSFHYHLYTLFDKRQKINFSSWEATEYIWRRLEPQIY